MTVALNTNVAMTGLDFDVGVKSRGTDFSPFIAGGRTESTIYRCVRKD